MTIQDTVPITTLERAVSTDVNTMQALSNRQQAEIVRSMVRKVQGGQYTDTPTTTIRPHIASGLIVNPAVGGLTVEVQAGVLCQQIAPSPPDVPTPDTFDSTYRFGLLMATEDVGDPWDASTAFWLLQARVERETTLSEVRDIYNPALGTFAPSAVAIDKRYESQPEFSWLKGTATDIPVHSVGYAPIAWCYRLVGGGVISEFDMGSMCIQLEDISPENVLDTRVLRKNYTLDTVNGIGRLSSSYTFDLEAEVAGLRCFARTEGGVVSLNTGSFQVATEAATLIVANTWGYVYLAPLPDAMPKKNAGLQPWLEISGVLVVSRVPPDAHGANSAIITPAAPWTNYPIPAGEAAHMGIIRSRGGAASDYYARQTESGHGRIDAVQLNGGAFQLSQGNDFCGPLRVPAGAPYTQIYDLSILGPGGTEDVPYGVALHCYMEHSLLPGLGAPAPDAAMESTIGMGSGALTKDDTTQPSLWPRMILSTTSLQSKTFVLYPRPGDLNMTVSFIPRTLAMANSGAGPAGCAGMTAVVGMWGYQF